MVRKITAIAFCVLIAFAICDATTAKAYDVYEGTPSNTYIQYFKDIVSGIGFNDNYVAFRSGQYEYTMIVGALEYDGTTIRLVAGETAKVYTISNESSYNSYYRYGVDTTTSFSVVPSDRIVYTDVGQADFPQLVERGAKYEMLSAVLLCVGLLGVVIGRIFSSSKR